MIILVGLAVLLTPAAIVALFAHLTRRQPTRRRATARIVVLVAVAAGCLVAGYLGTRGTSDGCSPGDCMFDFDRETWILFGAPAIVTLMYCIDAAFGMFEHGVDDGSR